MGRKKKIIEEPEKEVKVKTSSNSFSYTGKVSISLKKGNRTCFTKHFKNKGRWPLFYFLNMCLRGDYKTAELYRPKYINAFGDATLIGQNEPTISDDISLQEGMGRYFKEDTRTTVSSYPYQTLPDVNIESTEQGAELNIGSSSITYKFDIPFSQVKDNKPITAFALYAKPIQSWEGELAKITNPCAYFFIMDENKKIIDLLADINNGQSTITDDYNLYIEWTLSISNSEIKGE